MEKEGIYKSSQTMVLFFNIENNLKKMNTKNSIIITALLWFSIESFTQNIQTSLDYINPFIGTAATGHTFPGATTPFALVQLSPDLGTTGWQLCSGYHSDLSKISGFSHTHLNGTGCGDLGDISILPVIGKINFDKGILTAGYPSSFSHDSERASPGYYAVRLDDYHIDVELTASQHVGFHKYTFAPNDSLSLLVDLASNIGNASVIQSTLKIVDPLTVLGHKVVMGWPGRRDVYFAMKLSQPIEGIVLRDDWKKKNPGNIEAKISNARNIVVDGDLNDAAWNFDKKILKKISGINNNQASFDLKWDSKYLYVAVKVTDAVICTDSDKPWNDDGIEVYIDGNNSSDNNYDDFDRHFVINAGKEGVHESRGRKINVLQKNKLTKEGYNVEMAIEWASLNFKAEQGTVFGFDIAVNDDDNNGDRDGQTMWNGAENNWQTTEFLGTVELDSLTNKEDSQKKSKPSYINQIVRADFKINLFPREIDVNKGIISMLTFNNKAEKQLLVKVGISTTTADAALAAIDTEIPDWDFEKTKNKAADAWTEALSSIRIEAPKEIKDIFYTGLYHAMIQPNIISDIDGKFRGPDGKIYSGPNGKYYSTFSLWDTYRAWNPLMTIIDPSRVSEMVNSLIYSFDFQGYLPRWPLWGGETNCMIGNHAIPVIVDAYLKGIKGFDAEHAYETIKATSMNKNPLSNWPVYNKYGYLPYDIEKTESVSRTLEMSFNDWCVAQMAKSLGRKDDYDYFSKRGAFYKNVFDKSTGFMRGKDSTGNWIQSFNPIEVAFAGNGYGCYTEGNAWQHAWYVPQNIPDLVLLMGGKEKFVIKLDSLFTIGSALKGEALSDVSGLIGQYAHGNEPSHHVAYLYNYAGEPWKTQEMIRLIMKTLYDNSRSGLCGNDDCGQMSAWYILSAMGFYPVNPASGIYDIGSPVVEKAVINVGNNKQFVVEVKNQSAVNVYIKSVSFNDKILAKPQITHEQIMNGGILKFEMTDKPCKDLFN